MQKFLFARIEVWVLLAVILVGLLAFLGYGGVILDQVQGQRRFGAIGTAAVAVAEVPGTIEAILKADDPMQVYAKHRFEGPDGWSWAGGATGAALPGYWIMSRFDVALQHSFIEMVRLSDGQIVHSWVPDVESLLAGTQRTSKIAIYPNWTNAKYKVYQPWLMPNGDLILKDEYSPLLRIDACARKVLKQDAELFHHSTEPDGEGGFWIPSIVEPSSIEGVPETFVEDALTHVTADGKILAQISLPQMLMRHGMSYLMFSPGGYSDDPLHLNDIQPVLSDGPWWKAGDLFISLRHKSTVLLYRPATDEIVWTKSGPWMGQHDVDVLDDHRIAVFNNRAQNRGTPTVMGTSEITVYDFATDRVSHPYQDVMARERVVSLYEGLYTILPGGDYIIEDHNSGRILIFAADGRKLGQFINRNPDGKVYQIGWGRYVDQAYGDDALRQMQAIACRAQ